MRKFSIFVRFLHKKMKISVIGESNIDISVVCHINSESGGCVPGKIRFHHGGVSRNIAHNLCVLGQRVQLVSVFGDDEFAQDLVSECELLGMDLSLSTRFENTRSPLFLTYNDKEGNMISAVSDMEVNHRMDLAWIKDKMNLINQSEVIVADTLLDPEALSYLIDNSTSPLYIDTVSPKKALRFVEAILGSKKHRIHALKCNLEEGIAITNQTDPIKIVKEINALGVQQVFMTMGAEGVVFGNDGAIDCYPTLPSAIVNVTGSGDAFFSGVIYGNIMNLTSEQTIRMALKLAKLTLENEGPILPSNVNIKELF